MLYPVLARDPAFSHIFLFGPVPELLAPNTFYISSPGQLSNPPVTPPKILWGGGGLLPSRLHVFWATWPHPFSTCLELSSHLNNYSIS